jgi:hypothetical protein
MKHLWSQRLWSLCLTLKTPLLGVVLAYVLVVQAVVAPLHALAGVPLGADHALQVICVSHDQTGPDGAGAIPQAETDCCEIGCASASFTLMAVPRGAGALISPPLALGRDSTVALFFRDDRPPERLGGERHSPRAPPHSLS